MRSYGPELPSCFNAAEYFVDRRLKEGKGSATAIHFQAGRITFAEIADQVDRAANMLRDHGVGAGDRVFILLPDSPAFAVAFWGAIKMGAVALPSNTFLSPETYAVLLQDSAPRCVVVDSALIEKLDLALSHTSGSPAKNLLILVADSSSIGVSRQPCGRTPSVSIGGHRVLSFERELAEASPDACAANTRPNDPALWLYTSGSTGQPKAAIHRHSSLVFCYENIARGVFNISPEDRCFSVSKLFFAYGLGNALYFPFGAGAQAVLVPERLTPERVFEVLRQYRPTLLFAVPTLYASLLRVADAGRDDFRSVRCAGTGGEALPPVIGQQFEQRFGVQLLDGIGSTEMLQTFMTNRPGDVRYGSSGKPSPGYQVKIVDESGEDVTSGETGNLWVRGASAASGYWNRPEQTRATFRGEWTVTGDKYRCDPNGYYWHCGRSDDMLKIHGLWVSPLEIEAALLAHPAVAECAVVGFKDCAGFQRPRAFITLRNEASPQGQEALTHELASFLIGRISSHKIPASFVFTAEIPKTTTGKIQRYKLREP